MSLPRIPQHSFLSLIWSRNFGGLRTSRQRSGVSCRARLPIWQPIGYPAALAHPPHAIGTRGPLGDQITSIEASFDFSVQRSLKYPHVRPQMGNFATASRLESDPFPPPRSRGVQTDPLGPLSQNRRRTSGWELESQIWGPPPWSCIIRTYCYFAAPVGHPDRGGRRLQKAASLSSGPEGRRSAEQALRVPHVCPEP